MPKRSHKSIPLSDDEGSQRKGSTGTIRSEGGFPNPHTPSKASESEVHPLLGTAPTQTGSMRIRHISPPTPVFSPGTTSTGSQQGQGIRFPKLEEYAHFHYDLVEIPILKLRLCEEEETSGYKHNVDVSDQSMYLVTVTGSAVKPWLIRRSVDNFCTLDKQLHKCIFDRKFSQLEDLKAADLDAKPREEVHNALHKYLDHLSKLAGGMINCGSVLSWMEMDNRGHRLVATDDSGINTPAIAAAHVIKRYNAQAADEISLQVGDMISVIDMPPAEDTIWWRGKRGFEVGFFPSDCVEVIRDKIPSSMASRFPEPVATASAQRRPLMRKHGKLLSFLRTFFSHRPPRNQLKQSGIVKERVFGCDLGEHLLNSGHDVPLVLKSCTEIIEEYGIVHGIYRLSGITSNIQKLRLAFDEDRVPDLTEECYLQDIHSISSLLKMYFRELPNPLLTYQLYDKFAEAVRDEDNKLLRIHDVVQQLPPPHYRTTEYLMKHLARLAAYGHETEMHSKNLAIVWAPNLLRSKELEAGGGAAALQGVGIQAVVTECLICYCDLIFNDKMPSYALQEGSNQKKPRPKSLAISTPTRLLSLEEARERAFVGHLDRSQKFIDVGGGPKNLPSKYHTVLDLPGYKKKIPSRSKEDKNSSGKKSPTSTQPSSGWKSIFTKPRSGSVKKARKSSIHDAVTIGKAQAKALTEEDVHNWKRHLRSAKSAESLFSIGNSSHNSLNSHTGRDRTESAGNMSSHPQFFDLSNKENRVLAHLAHKRSLSSDASAIIRQRCMAQEPEPVHVLATEDAENPPKEPQFIRGDSTRKPFHRRIPSAPTTPQHEHKSKRDYTGYEEMELSFEDFVYPKSSSRGDINIDAAIKSRLQQVADKSRSPKSPDDPLTSSPLKRGAKTPPKERKKVKAISVRSHSEDEARSYQSSPRKHASSNDTSPYDNDDRESRMRRFYARFHDYAEIISDEDGRIRTPGSSSQGTLSLSSSGCNMQEVLDQIDTRLAANSIFYERYRPSTSPSSLQSSPCGNKNLKSASLSSSLPPLRRETSSNNFIYVKETEFPVTNISPREITQTKNSEVDKNVQSEFNDSTRRRRLIRGDSNKSSQRRDSKTMNQNSTRVNRRHVEYIPNARAIASENMDHYLDTLDSTGNFNNGQNSNCYNAVQISSPFKRESSLKNSPRHRRIHHQNSGQSKSFIPSAISSNQNFSQTTQIECNSPMVKCLSVPSDIAKSLENVTESQTDMMSSVTISELSASVNSFGNGFDDRRMFGNFGYPDEYRQRRSTSLDSLSDPDRRMTRTLREINKQMEVAFQSPDKTNSKITQRLISSDLDINSDKFTIKNEIVLKDEFINENISQNSDLKSDPTITPTCESNIFPPRNVVDSNFLCPHSLAVPGGDTYDSESDFDDSFTHVTDAPSVGDVSLLSPISTQNIPNPEREDIISPNSNRETNQLGLDTEIQHPHEKYVNNTIPFMQNQSMESSGKINEIEIREEEEYKGLKHENNESNHPSKKSVSSSLSSDSEEFDEVASPDESDKEPELFVRDESLTKNLTLPVSEKFLPSTIPCGINKQASDSHDPYRDVLENPISTLEISKGLENSNSINPKSSDIYDPSRSALHNPISALEISTECETPTSKNPLEKTSDIPVVVRRRSKQPQELESSTEDIKPLVVPRRISPRVEQRPVFEGPLSPTSPKSPRNNPNQEFEDFKKLQSSGIVSSNEFQPDAVSELMMSSLQAAGLISQRARLSRESSTSSLQSPDSSYANIIIQSKSPVPTPDGPLPDLIQSASESYPNPPTNSSPLHIALYHPEEFNLHIRQAVGCESPRSNRSTNPPLPEVQTSREIVMERKPVMRKSSTDNSIHNRNENSAILSSNLQGIQSSNPEESMFLVRSASDSRGVRRTQNPFMEKVKKVGPDSLLESETTQLNLREAKTQIRNDNEVKRDNGSDQVEMEVDNLCNKLVDDLNSSPEDSSFDSSSLGINSKTKYQQNQVELSSHGAIAMEIDTSSGSIPSPPIARDMSSSDSRTSSSSISITESRNLRHSGLDKESTQNVLNTNLENIRCPETNESSQPSTERLCDVLNPPTPATQSCSYQAPRKASLSKIPRPKADKDGSSKSPNSPHSSHPPFRRQESTPICSYSESSNHSRKVDSKRIGHTRRASDTRVLEFKSPTTPRTPPILPRSDSGGSSRTSHTRTRASSSESKEKTESPRLRSNRNVSHRVTSPAADKVDSGLQSPKVSKIPSPKPKPRKGNGTPSKQSVSRTSSSNSTNPPEEVFVEVTRSSVKKTEKSKPESRKIESKKVVVKELNETAKLVIEKGDTKKRIQTVHAKKVAQPTRHVAKIPEINSRESSKPKSSDTSVKFDLSNQNETKTVDMPCKKDKTPPLVPPKKYQYYSKSLPRKGKSFQTRSEVQVKTESNNEEEFYSEMIGSRSSLDDSALQLAAERHDEFVPDSDPEKPDFSYLSGSLRSKRSEKMQSLMNLFERHSESLENSESSSGSPSLKNKDSFLFNSQGSGSGSQLPVCIETGDNSEDLLRFQRSFSSPPTTDTFIRSKTETKEIKELNNKFPINTSLKRTSPVSIPRQQSLPSASKHSNISLNDNKTIDSDKYSLNESSELSSSVIDDVFIETDHKDSKQFSDISEASSKLTHASRSSKSSSKTPPTSPRKDRDKERRGSIKELVQVFEHTELNESKSTQISSETPSKRQHHQDQPTRLDTNLTTTPKVKVRIRSVSPQPAPSHRRTDRSNITRFSLEIPSTSTHLEQTTDIRSQTLRLGPKPFYGPSTSS